MRRLRTIWRLIVIGLPGRYRKITDQAEFEQAVAADIDWVIDAWEGR